MRAYVDEDMSFYTHMYLLYYIYLFTTYAANVCADRLPKLGVGSVVWCNQSPPVLSLELRISLPSLSSFLLPAAVFVALEETGSTIAVSRVVSNRGSLSIMILYFCSLRMDSLVFTNARRSGFYKTAFFLFSLTYTYTLTKRLMLLRCAALLQYGS